MALLYTIVLMVIVLKAPKTSDKAPKEKSEKSVEVGYFPILVQFEFSDDFEQIAEAIQRGSATFLRTEYFYIFMFVVLVFILISASPYLEDNADKDDGWRTAINFLIGSTLSALAGYVGMFTAVRSNVRLVSSPHHKFPSRIDTLHYLTLFP